MRLCLIAALADNDVIGRAGDIPWHLPADLQHFKRLTLGHTLVMGRKTYASLKGPLPDRRVVVLTQDASFSAPGVDVVRPGDAPFAPGRRGWLEPYVSGDDVFVGGGEDIYRLALPHADVMYLTRVHTTVDGDTRFPPFDPADWERTSAESRPADERNAYAMTFETWERHPTPRSGN